MKNLRNLLMPIAIDFYLLDKSTQVAIKLIIGSFFLALSSYVVQWIGFNILDLPQNLLSLTFLGVTKLTQNLLLINYLYCVLSYAIFFYYVVKTEEAKYERKKLKEIN